MQGKCYKVTQTHSYMGDFYCLLFYFYFSFIYSFIIFLIFFFLGVLHCIIVFQYTNVCGWMAG